MIETTAAKPQKIKSKLVKVAAQSLRIHPSAQRALVPSKLRQFKDDLDLDAIGVLHGVEYEIDGVLAIWIIDGQHRWRALMDHGFGEWEVEVKIHTECKDDRRASELFLKLNNRTPVGPYDKFDNARKAGDLDAIRIDRIVTDRALKLARGADDGCICCICSLRQVFTLDQGVALESALDTLIAAWGRKASTVEGKLVEGFGLFFKTYNGAVERPALLKKLQKYPGGASGLVGDAKALKDIKHMKMSRAVAERVVETYNAKRTTGRLDPL